MDTQSSELHEYFGSPYLEQLWKASTGALVLCDANRFVVRVSPAFTDLFKISPENSIGSDLDDLITPPPFLSESECIFDTAITGTPISLMTIKALDNGKLIRVFQVAVQIITDSGNRLVCFIFKQIPENSSLRSSDMCEDCELLSSAFENSLEPSLFSDKTGRVIRANTAFHSEFQWEPAELAQQSISELLIPESIKPESKYISAMQEAGKILRLRTVRKKKTGENLQISLISAPRMCGTAEGYRIYRTSNSIAQTTVDISARNDFKECPNSGFHSGMFFHSRLDKMRTMEFIAPGTSSLAGYSETELLSEERPFLSVILSEDRAMVLETLNNALTHHRDYSITYRILDNSGDILWVMERGKVYKMTDGESDFCVGSIIDVSETRKDREQSSLARDRIEKLHSVAAELQQCRSEGEIYRICTEAGQSLLNSSCSSVFIQDGSKMKQIASSGRELHNCTRECSPGMVELALSTVSPCYFTSRDKGENLCPGGSSGACFRLSDKAVFQIISPSDKVFGDIDARITELLLGYTQQGLKRIALQQQLINQALHDPLTGIHNRYYFNRIIELEELRARRLNSSIGFIMIDVDDFKMVNDKYGHQTGDTVLCEVAKSLENALRKTDTVLRYGGDEFLIILTRMATDYCHKVEDRINSAIANSQGLLMIDGDKVTVSMGHAFWTPSAKESIDEILGMADTIMYENKRKKLKKQ